MSSHYYETAAILNNEALYYITSSNKQQKYDIALDYFSRALEYILQAKNKKYYNELKDNAMMMPSSTSSAKRITTLSYDQASSPHNSFTFYNKMFYIDPNNYSTHHNQTNNNDNVLLTMMIHYNMANTCHRIGLEQDSAYFYQALSFYKLVISLSQNFDQRITDNDIILQEQQQQQSVIMNVLLMASFTNMGHIYSHFFLDDEIALCRRFLETLLVKNPNVKCYIDHDEYNLFFLNSALFTNANPVINQGAAAA